MLIKFLLVANTIYYLSLNLMAPSIKSTVQSL
jgi:hypothetical protein